MKKIELTENELKRIIKEAVREELDKIPKQMYYAPVWIYPVQQPAYPYYPTWPSYEITSSTTENK